MHGHNIMGDEKLEILQKKVRFIQAMSKSSRYGIMHDGKVTVRR